MSPSTPGPDIRVGAFGAAAGGARDARGAHPKRILLIRLSAFGDIVIATGLLHGLKRAYPDAEIDWLVQPEFAELLRTQSAIAQVQVWPRKQWGLLWRGFRWLALWRAVRDFAYGLRARDYDWVIDAQGLFKSRALARLAGGRLRAGYTGKEPGTSWMHRLVQRFPEAHPQRRFIGDEHAPMLEALTGQRQVIPKLSLPTRAESSYLIAAPFTTRPQKHWPQKHWISLLQSLVAEGHRVLLLGGPADRAAAANIVANVVSPLLDDRVGQTTFVEAARLVASASAVVGVDTGITHLGFALDRPTVALLGSTRPYAAAFSEEAGAVLFEAFSCAPCGRKPTCHGRYDCLRQLTPTLVVSTLRVLLNRQSLKAVGSEI